MDLEQLLRLLQQGGPIANIGGGAAQAGATGLVGALGGPPGILLSLLPTLLSLLHGDPSERNRAMERMLSSPEHLMTIQQALLKHLGANPENVAARANIVNQSSSLASDLNRSLSARGLGTTGIAAVAQPIANSAVSGRLSSFEGSLSSGALQRAQEIVRQQMEAAQRNPYGQSQFQGGLDKSFGALLPAIGDYYKRRYQAPIARIA